MQIFLPPNFLPGWDDTVVKCFMVNFLRKFIVSRYVVAVALTLVLTASVLFLVQSLWITQYKDERSQASSLSINLANQTWYARQGFSNGDVGGFDADLPGVRKIGYFPIQLNTLFQIPSGQAANDFTLMVTVDLDAQVLSQNLVLSLAQIGDNWAVYLNGMEIQREIYLDSNGQILRQRSMQNVLISIPQNTVRVGPNTFVFHIIGNAPTNPLFAGWQVGFSMSNGYLLGSFDPLIKVRTLQDAFAWLQMGVYIFFGILQLFLFFRQKEIYSFYFGLFLFSCAIYSFSYSNVAFSFILDTAVIYRMMFGANFIWPGLVGLTLWSYLYPGKTLRIGLVLLAGLSLMMTLGVWIVPMVWIESLMAVFLLVVTGCAIYLLQMIIGAVREKIRDARKILIAGYFVFVLVVWTVLDIFIFRTGIDLIGWTPFFLASAFAIIFIERLWKTTLELTETNRQLRVVRDTIEGQVILRTSQLSSTNTKLEEKLAEISALQDSLREMTIRDALTGLFNRRFLDETLDREFALTRRQHIVSLVMVDIDHFKALNDTYGHKAGDQVLKAISNRLLSHFRQSDFIFRFGGEEFLIVLPGVQLGDALRRSNELCQMIQQMPIDYEDQALRITISIGVAEIHSTDETPDQALKRADAALYIAKSRGRNRVEAEDDLS